jgi:hypothetical protein
MQFSHFDQFVLLNIDMRVGTGNVRSLYRADSVRTVAEEISKYKLDLVGVQEVRWDRRGTEPAREYTFFIYRTIILPVVLYECETRSLTLRMEHRLRVFENRVLRRIFGPKRDEVIGGWRKLHNEDLHNLYPSPSIIRMIKSRRMRCARHM